MIQGILDTNLLIEIYRSVAQTSVWLASQTDMAVTSISWLEFMQGARGRAGQRDCLEILKPFEVVTLNRRRSAVGNGANTSLPPESRG